MREMEAYQVAMQYNCLSHEPTTHQESSDDDNTGFEANIQFVDVPENQIATDQKVSHYRKSLLLESEKALKKQESRESISRHSSLASGTKSRSSSHNNVIIAATSQNMTNMTDTSMMNQMQFLKPDPKNIT